MIPSSYLKKGRGRIEKTEIIEMAIKHMRHLQTHSNCRSIEKCELLTGGGEKGGNGGGGGEGITPKKEPSSEAAGTSGGSAGGSTTDKNIESFRVGYHECLSETMHFLVEKEGMYSGDPLCQRLMAHLQRHFEKLNKGEERQATKSWNFSFSCVSSSLSVKSSRGYPGGPAGEASSTVGGGGSAGGDHRPNPSRAQSVASSGYASRYCNYFSYTFLFF